MFAETLAIHLLTKSHVALINAATGCGRSTDVDFERVEKKSQTPFFAVHSATQGRRFSGRASACADELMGIATSRHSSRLKMRKVMLTAKA